MRQRALGGTGLTVSELSLGTWGLSGDAYGRMDTSDQEAVVSRAVQLGITLFETADVYGSGAMERLLGRLVPASSIIVTKVGTDLGGTPPRKRFDAAYLDSAITASSERLERPTLDVVLLHNPSAAVLVEGEAPRFLHGLREAGRLRAWGVSVGDATVGRAAVSAGAEVIELAYNAFHSNLLLELTTQLTASNIGVLARSALAHGLLAGHWTRDRTFPRGDHRATRWTPSELRTRISQLDALRSVIGDGIVSLRAAALRFVLSNELVGSAVLGARTTVQLDQLVREAGEGPPYLSDEKRIKLMTRLQDVGIHP